MLHSVIIFLLERVIRTYKVKANRRSTARHIFIAAAKEIIHNGTSLCTINNKLQFQGFTKIGKL